MLKLDNLAFERNDQLLFSNINCQLYAGEYLQIQGPNGSGKSTLLRVIAGFIEPQHGAVLWKNKPNLHYIGHQNGIKPLLTVIENIQLSAALSLQQPTRHQINTVLHEMGLTHAIHTQALNLSAGQLRRLTLAKLQLMPSQAWMLDEPTTALDANGQELLTTLLNQHLQLGGIAILATHHHLALKGTMKSIQLGNPYD